MVAVLVVETILEEMTGREDDQKILKEIDKERPEETANRKIKY